MVSIKRYLSLNFTKSFLMVFLPFFIIISLIYLVKISSLTTQISLSPKELLMLYSYSIPEIIYYTIPISFVASLTSVLSRLSTDNELVAIFSLGMSSKSIVSNLEKIAFLFTVLLLCISFFAIPISKQYYKSFKEHKKTQAKLNIIPGELGQKFGNYYIYIEDVQPDTKNLKNIVIYNKSDKNNEEFFAAKEGKLKHQKNTTILELIDGYGYTYKKNNLQEAKYKTINVYKNIDQKIFNFKDIYSYWIGIYTNQKLLHKALFMFFVSFIPLISTYLIASFSIINPRYQKNHTFLTIFVTTITLYTIATILHKHGNLYIVFGIIFSIIVTGRYLFNKRVERFF